MSTEFTGERVVPGQVDVDLWNEHLSRYAFAARLARRKRVLDIGCGTGYGSAELSRNARSVTSIDISADAVQYAQSHYADLRIAQASAVSLPFADQSFDLVVGFEVIEHLSDWEQMLSEAKRVLAANGQFVVSTPNKAYYEESRGVHGPNPFHEHEFTLDEFREALERYFPNVLLFTENHADSIVFRPLSNQPNPAADVRLDPASGAPEEAHFFVAVCAAEPMTGAPAFLYVPSSANVLREREEHIHRLEAELKTKDAWLEQAQTTHAALVREHEAQTEELKRSNEWALSLNQRIAEAGERLTLAGQRIAELDAEIDRIREIAHVNQQAYEAECQRLESERQRVEGELATAIRWGQDKETELTGELTAARKQFADTLDLLHDAERTVEERTLWAQSLSAELETLKTQLALTRESKWIRLGRSIGVGPRFE